MWIEIGVGAVSLFAIFYVYLTWKWDFWAKRGVPFVEPKFPFGSMPEFFTKSRHLVDAMAEHGQRFKNEPYYGVFFFR